MVTLMVYNAKYKLKSVAESKRQL